MIDRAAEWIKQSDYDMDTAHYMYNGGRYAYAVFMCHLSIEKLLKGLYQHKTDNAPPKTHNLIYLISQSGIKPDKKILKSIALLNEANIAARYPESLDILQKNYTKIVALNLINQSEEVILWIKKQF